MPLVNENTAINARQNETGLNDRKITGGATLCSWIPGKSEHNDALLEKLQCLSDPLCLTLNAEFDAPARWRKAWQAEQFQLRIPGDAVVHQIDQLALACVFDNNRHIHGRLSAMQVRILGIEYPFHHGPCHFRKAGQKVVLCVAESRHTVV